jgi:DNA-binding transcriptional MerR regulator
MKDKHFFIGEVAGQVGVNRKTIRYYEDINLLPKSKRGENNYRVYSQDTVKRLSFIKKAQSLGFTLSGIKEILTLRDRGFTPCNHVQDLLRQRLIDIEQKLAELTIIKRELKKLESEWAKMQTVEDNKGEGICPQIEKVKFQPTKKPSKPFYSRK